MNIFLITFAKEVVVYPSIVGLSLCLSVFSNFT